MRRILFFVSLAVVLTFRWADAEEGDPVLAKAGDYVFRQSDFIRLMSYSPPSLQEQLKGSAQNKELLIRRIMQHKIIADMAKKEGFEKKTEVKEQLQYLIDDFLVKEYLVQNVVEKVAVTEDDVKKNYQDNIATYTVPEQVRARHILIKVPFGASEEEKRKAKEKMNNILEWLKKGEKFETLAEQYSEDTKSNKQGGDLGYFPRGKMPKAFDTAAFSLKPWQISDIVETDHGYHIIQVEKLVEAKIKGFDEVKVAIKEQLTNDLAKSRVEEFVKKVEKDAGLEVFSAAPGKNKK
jgi:peptidyl-prolyl cis-trans isomerase C